MSVQGVIGRETRDVRLAMRALIHHDPRDPWMVPMPFDGPARRRHGPGGFHQNTFEFDLHPAVDKALDTARNALVDAGYEVVECEPPQVREIAREAGKCLFGEFDALVRPDIRKYGSDTINTIFEDYNAYFDRYEGTDRSTAIR